MPRCAHQYRFGQCLHIIAEGLELCLQHDPAAKAKRSGAARKANRGRKPQGLYPAQAAELARVKRWFDHGGGAEAFEAFSGDG